MGGPRDSGETRSPGGGPSRPEPAASGRPSGPAPDPAPEPDPDGARWRAFATDTAGELRRQLAGASDELGEADADRVARRLADAIDDALEVPDDLPLRIAGDVARLRAEAGPGGDPVAIAWARARERARKTAAIGAVTTIPSMIPVLGPAIAALGVVADWRYVAAQQRDLVLEIAALFDVRLDDPTGRVRALFLTSTGAALAGSAVGEAVGRAAARRVARRGLARVVPGVGAVVAGALNYASTVAIGRAAIGRFAREAGLEVRGVVPGVAHPAMEPLRAWILDPSAPQGAPVEATAVAALSASEREELIDLAVVSTAGVEDGDARLATIVDALGFDAEEVSEAQRSFAAKVRGFAKRFRDRLARAGGGGRAAARRVWRDALRLASRARRWRRRSEEARESPSGP
ncbi:MAG TPA: hypothetical protein VML95_12720 [Longimicrobiales bacterium]|nr:hypothetical protein [Longimicrobiales bacterium]